MFQSVRERRQKESELAGVGMHNANSSRNLLSMIGWELD